VQAWQKMYLTAYTVVDELIYTHQYIIPT